MTPHRMSRYSVLQTHFDVRTVINFGLWQGAPRDLYFCVVVPPSGKPASEFVTVLWSSVPPTSELL